MKALATILFAVLSFAGIAKADTILIYAGSHTTRVNGGAGVTNASFVLFDLTTLQFAEVLYGVSAGTKFTSFIGPTAMDYDPVGLPGKRSETCFVYGTTTSTTPFLYKLGTYIGANSNVNIAGIIIGEYPRVLTFYYRGLSGDGTNADDDVTIASGVYSLNTKLTETSNASADNLTAATNVVTTYLTSKGF